MKEAFINSQRYLLTSGPTSKQVYRNRIKARHKAVTEIIQILMESPLYWCCPVEQRLELIFKHLFVS